MPKKTVTQMLAELRDMIWNPEMQKWAEKLDAGAHGAKQGATNLRVNLSALQKEAKVLRAEIQNRRP